MRGNERAGHRRRAGRPRPSTGTLAWAGETNGRLSGRRRAEQLAHVIRLQLARWHPSRRRHLGLDDGTLARLDTIMLVPDSSIARDAQALCAEVSSASLHNHCVRTYLWAALLGQRDAVAFDQELLYVAALLHDLGLTDVAPTTSHCFAVDGARAASDFARERGWPEQRRDALADAICLHLNVRVGAELGAEAHLLHAGAGFDVVGARFRDLPPAVVQGVLVHHPRLGFKRELHQLLAPQVERRPGCRIHFLHRTLRFGDLIDRAPFAE